MPEKNDYNIARLTTSNAQKFKALLEIIIDQIQLINFSGHTSINSLPSPFRESRSFIKIPHPTLIAKGIAPAEVGRMINGLDVINFKQFGSGDILQWEDLRISHQLKKTGENDFRLSPEEIGQVTVISYKDEKSIIAARKILQELNKMLKLEVDGAATKVIKKTINKFPIPLLPGAKWRHIEIKFIDGHIVDIHYAGKKVRTDYTGMGFRNEVTGGSDKAWNLLERLSHYEGETNRDFLSKEDIKISNQIKSRKKLLSQGLKSYFGLESDPLPFDPKDKCYKLGLTIIPSGGSISHSIAEEEVEKKSENDIMEGVQDLY